MSTGITAEEQKALTEDLGVKFEIAHGKEKDQTFEAYEFPSGKESAVKGTETAFTSLKEGDAW